MTPQSNKQRIFGKVYQILAHSKPSRGGVILTYHSISYAQHFGAVTPENFKLQMQALKHGGFSVVSLDELARLRRAGKIPPKTVAITFDDGYRDNYGIAYPILKEHGFPATIFVITDKIGGTNTARGEVFDMLSEEQIKELASSGLISIEPHTVSHPKLTTLSSEEAEQEIRTAKERIEKLTGSTCRHFAYPFGRHDKGSEEAARRAGIEYAYTTLDGFVQMNAADNWKLRRNGVNRTITLLEFPGIALWGKMTRARFGL